MIKNLYQLLGLALAVGLTACVTVTDNPKPKIDKQKVLESNIKLGMAYLRQDQRDNALRSFAKALEVDKNSAEAHQGMALIHQVNGEYEMAENSFQRALKSRSDFSQADIEYTYGRFLVEKGRCDQAFPYFENASRDLTYRRRVNALFNLGLCAERAGDEARAEAFYKHALNINNKFAPAALELAHKKFDKRDYAEAKRYLDLFAGNARQSARSLWLGIRIERIFGNRDKEASYVLALKNLHPYSREYLEYKKLTEAEK